MKKMLVASLCVVLSVIGVYLTDGKNQFLETCFNVAIVISMIGLFVTLIMYGSVKDKKEQAIYFFFLIGPFAQMCYLLDIKTAAILTITLLIILELSAIVFLKTKVLTKT